MSDSNKSFAQFRPHPWHGIDLRPDESEPGVVFAYIEMTPDDDMKYEVDKATGYIILDRPKKFSSKLPMAYGFVPKTYCGERAKALSPGSTEGDGDPLDICVLSEHNITRTEILIHARVIGGLRMIDGGEADDKIVAVIDGDPAWDHVTDISQVPGLTIQRLQHYFLTYKMKPNQPTSTVVDEIFGRDEAIRVVEATSLDYRDLMSGE